MADILVRGLGPDVVERLKLHAKRNGRSLQTEVKDILERAARTPDHVETQAAIKRVRRMFRGRRFSDSAVLIRQDRDR
jgi:plasmid stability protein